MHIQVINPNTSDQMTATIAAAAREAAAPGTSISAVNPVSGPPSIEGHYDEALAVPGLLEKVREGESRGVNGHVIACFGDPGLLAAREIATAPVVGIAEAAMHLATLVAPRFSVVTTLERTCMIAQHLTERYGMTRHCASIRATEIAVLDLDDPASNALQCITAMCRRALQDDGAEALVLGCAGMANMARTLSSELGVPVLEGVSAGVKLAESLAALGVTTSKTRGLAYPLSKPYSGTMEQFSP